MIKNYKEKYNEALEKAREAFYSPETPHVAKAWLLTMFPTIAESEDEKMRKSIIYALQNGGFYSKDKTDEAIAWLEKQDKNIVVCQQNHQDVKHPNGGIVMEDFNGGEGFYKLHLDCLSKKQVEEVEEMVRTWNKESKTSNENIKNCIGMCLIDANEQRFQDYNTTLKDCLAWLKKQGEKPQGKSALEAAKEEKVDNQNCVKPANRIEPKFRLGDTMRTWKEAANGYTDGMPVVVSMDDKYYHCTNELIAIKDQDNYEFPPINRKQKSSDKVEPKFKIEKGKWYVCIKDLFDDYMDKAFRKGDVYTSTQDGSLIPSNSNVPCKIACCPDTYFRDWTIQDAKDGDVLASELSDSIFLFKGIKDDKIDFYCDYYAGLECPDDRFDINDSSQHYGSVEESQDIHPATKEQRDLLFAKMKEAGYEWNGEKERVE